jgi:hypothetical protein
MPFRISGLPFSCTCVRACLCVCPLRKYWSLSWVTWCTFHSDTFPQIIWSFFIKEKMLSGFAIAHPGATPGTPVSLE